MRPLAHQPAELKSTGDVYTRQTQNVWSYYFFTNNEEIKKTKKVNLMLYFSVNHFAFRTPKSCFFEVYIF